LKHTVYYVASVVVMTNSRLICSHRKCVGTLVDSTVGLSRKSSNSNTGFCHCANCVAYQLHIWSGFMVVANVFGVNIYLQR